MATLDKYRRNVNSQNGEDGVIAELLQRIGIPDPGSCMEFGAGDGISLSNTLELTKRGWRTVLVEADATSAAACRAHAEKFPVGQVTLFEGFVGTTAEDGVDAILAKHAPDVPKNFDFLSIDIDSFDLQVWRAVTIYRPKIVLIEVNSTVPPGTHQEHGAPGVEGASFTSMVALGFQKNYVPVCHTGNVFFVDREYLPRVKLPMSEICDPNELFNWGWVQR